MSPAPEERRLHDVALPHRHAARGDERVGLDHVVEHGLLQRLGVVLHDAGEHRDRARLAQRAEDRVRVGIADLPELGRLGRRDQLVAGARARRRADAGARAACGNPAFASSPSSGAPSRLPRSTSTVPSATSSPTRTHVTARRPRPRTGARPRRAPRRSRSARSCRPPPGSARRSRSPRPRRLPTVASGR